MRGELLVEFDDGPLEGRHVGQSSSPAHRWWMVYSCLPVNAANIAERLTIPPLTGVGVPPPATGVPPPATGVPPPATGVPPPATGVPPLLGVPPPVTGVPPLLVPFAGS